MTVNTRASSVEALHFVTRHDAGAAHSRYVQRIRRRYAEELRLLAAGLPDRAALAQTLQALRQRGFDLAAALRVLRHLALERLAVLDTECAAPLQAVTSAMTELAEFALEQALLQTLSELDLMHGAPQYADPALPAAPAPLLRRCELWVIGMGKFGARELNVSSDIDLIYVYDQDGQTSGNALGRNKISNHEYFAKAVKGIFGLIGDITEHGQVFRVDLALRPHGNSGPTALSLGALEEYFQAQGREWERFAWLKSRIVAQRTALSEEAKQALRGVVLPFVFRRYLDYGVFEALRSLQLQIREHAAKRAAGHPERAHDVKLSRGGIREIEFTVQLLQVVRGGQFPELRTRPTLDALSRLERAGLMPPQTVQTLAQAYDFLRRVEHRIQYLDDQQTHILPSRDDDLHWIAQTMGLADAAAFLHVFNGHREAVALEFDALLGAGSSPCQGKRCHSQHQDVTDLSSVLEQLPPVLANRVGDWRQHPRVLALSEGGQARLARLLQRTGAWLETARVSTSSVLRLADWLELILRRESYLALLQECPSVHERLLHMLGAAKWPARYLLKHPGVIDELASQQLYDERFDSAQFESDLEQRKLSLQATGEDDDEELLNLLRRAHHAEVFRTLARDVEGMLTVEQVADDLSALADSVLLLTGRWCWERLPARQRHRTEPCYAIIGYGKLGSKELGYGSDLDIVFVYEDDDEQAAEVYTALARKMIHWLTINTGEGQLYEIDTELRPNSNSGLLVIPFSAYANYQQQRGSNTAWTWEHQAITRARFVCGDETLRERFDAVRTSVLCAAREPGALKQEILAMRQRIRQARPVKAGRFDCKHSPGGMVDVEFAVQFLVLTASARYPELRANVGNIALLQRTEAVGLLPSGVGATAARAYRRLRERQHRARLDEAATQFDPATLAAESAAVMALWQAVFAVA